MSALLYSFGFTLKVTEQVKEEVRVTHSYYTEVEKFWIFGGVNRHFWKDGRGGLGDADLMSEFYQAKELKNIIVQKYLNRETLIIDKVYDLRLPFEFTFEVQSLSPSSSFRSLQLDAKNARIAEPPERDSRYEELYIEFSDPKIIYRHDNVKGNTKRVVKDEL